MAVATGRAVPAPVRGDSARAASGALLRARRRSVFDRATAIRPVGDGVFLAEIHEGWSVSTGPSGGYLAAILVRALLADRDADAPGVLRALALSYLKPSRPGPLSIELDSLRCGRLALRTAVRAHQDGVLVLCANATFSVEDLPSVAEWPLRPPASGAAPPLRAREVPADRYSPSARQWLELPADLPEVIHHAKLAPQFGHGRFSGSPGADGGGPETGGWMMLRGSQRIDLPYLALCADLWWPASLEGVSRPARAPTLDLTLHLRKTLPVGGLPDQPILAHFRARSAAEGLVDEDGSLFLPDGTLLAQVRQLSLLAPTA